MENPVNSYSTEQGSQDQHVDYNSDQDSQVKQTVDKLNTLSETKELSSLSAAHRAMKSLKDLVPCEFTREEITQSADELINSLNAKRKRDSEILEDFKKTAELQTKRSCTIIEQQMFKVYEKQGKSIQGKIQELYTILDRISKLETKIQEFKRALQGLCHEFNE